MRFIRTVLVLLLLGTAASAPASEKPERWLQARSAHFVVVTQESENTARRLTGSAEQIRAVFHAAFPDLRLDPPLPITILAVRGEPAFRELVPEFWEKKGIVHPSGIFAWSADRSFIAIRLDTPGTDPAHLLAHEYAHIFLRLNASAYPLWLDEGFAEFFATARPGSKDAQLGLTNPSHLEVLGRGRLLPFDSFLAADAASPYYNNPQQAATFYAQSWLLTHQLVFSGPANTPSRLSVLLGLLAAGLAPRDAAQQVLGDSAKAQEDLEAYLRRGAFKTLRVRVSVEGKAGEASLQELSPADSAAVRGLFLLYQERPVEARKFLDDALRLDPKSPLAAEGMGFFFFRGHRNDEAAAWFGRAVEGNSPGFLPYYYHAALKMRGALDAASSAQVERELKRALELNPDYAPACEALASLYQKRGADLDQARALAQHAVDLEPRVAGHKLVLAGILLAQHRNLEAKVLAQGIVDSAASEDDRAAAQALLAAVRSTERPPDVALGPGGQVTAPAASGGPTAKPGPTKARPSGKKTPQPRQLSAQGAILNVTCSDPAVMDLKLTTPKGTLTLHTANYFKVDFLTRRWTPPNPFHPCEHIQGHTARVLYVPAQGQAYNGEFSSVEVLK